MKHLFCVITCLILMACGPKEEPKSSADARDLGDTTDGLDGVDSSRDDSTSDGASAEPEGPATPADFQAVLQLVIDDETLLSAMRLTEPGRFPLKLAGRDVPRDVELTASSEPVEIVDIPGESDAAVLIVTDFEISGADAALKMKYPPERLRARATLEKVDHGWVLANSSQSTY